MANTESTSYDELVDMFFDRIKDYDLAALSESVAHDVAASYISPACARYIGCRKDLSDRDDDMECFNCSLSAREKNILVSYMVLEWLDSNFIFTSAALKARLTPTDYKSLDTKDMLGKLLTVHDTLLAETKEYGIRLSYNDSSMFDIVTKRGRS